MQRGIEVIKISQIVRGMLKMPDYTEECELSEASNEIIAIVADIEEVCNQHYRNFSDFCRDFITVIKNAAQEDDDPIEAVKYWLKVMLDQPPVLHA